MAVGREIREETRRKEAREGSSALLLLFVFVAAAAFLGTAIAMLALR